MLADFGKTPSFFSSSIIPVSAVMLDDGSTVSILSPQEVLTHQEIATVVLGLKTDISPEQVGDLLVKRGYILTEAQGKEAERRMGKKILPEGGSIIFFTKAPSPGDPVMVSFGGFLGGHSCSLKDGVRCNLDNRIFVPNLKLPRFDSSDDVEDDAA